MSVRQTLGEIAASTSTSARPSEYLAFLEGVLVQPASTLNAESLRHDLSVYLDEAVFSDANSQGGGLIVGRQVLSDFNDAIAKAGKRSATEEGGDQVMESDGDKPAIKDETVRREILEHALEKAQPRVLSFEEQVSKQIVVA